MKFHFDRFIRAIMLAGFSLLIFYLHITNQIGQYLHLEYLFFVQLASVLFLFLFFIQVKSIFAEDNAEHDLACELYGCTHEEGIGLRSKIQQIISYTILILPLVVGFLIAPTILDSSIAEKRVVITGATIKETTKIQTGSNNSQHIVLTEENYAIETTRIRENPIDFAGAIIELSGMLHKTNQLAEKQYVISRFQMTHCVADATVISFLVEFDEHPHFHENDNWVKIKGVLEVVEIDSHLLPSINVKSWEKIDMPENPYVCR